MKYLDLCNQGVDKLMTYEPGKPIEEVARELGIDDPDSIIKLASNENALGPSPRALTAMSQMAESIHLYPDGGAFYLREAIAAKLGVKPDQILPGNGSNELIELLAHAFLGPDAGIVMADMSFVVYRLVAAAQNAPVISVPMKDFTHDLDAMLAAIEPSTRIVFVSNPNNPTGTMVSGKELEAFVEQVPDHVIACIDEAYIELLPPEKQPDMLKYIGSNRNVVVLRTFSKAYGLAGLRIGYAVADAECISLLHKVRQPFNVNSMAQAAAIAALQDDEHVASSRELVRDGLAYFEKEFTKAGLRFVPSVANFIMVEVGNGKEVFQMMQRKGVIVRPMAGQISGWVRITVGTPEENLRCMKALLECIK